MPEAGKSNRILYRYTRCFYRNSTAGAFKNKTRGSFKQNSVNHFLIGCDAFKEGNPSIINP